MNQRLSLLAALAFATLAASCGPMKHAGDTRYSYNLSSNGCGTGAHAFSSLEAMCSGLQDEDLNKGCAWDLRKNLFEQSHCADDKQNTFK